MSERMNYAQVSPDVYKLLLRQHQYLQSCGLEPALIGLVFLRASQINQCAFCVRMHWRELRHLGVSEDKLATLPAWRESQDFSERERAALAWTEAVTVLTDGYVSDDTYAAVEQIFTEKELADLTLAVVSINSWNRLNVAFRKQPDPAVR